tara:strand:- start:421 stop:936 length:516 start_codon:yes stop_codon:yes gene_type:complete
MCNEFFKLLPKLLEESEINDPDYEKMLYITLELNGYEQIKKINEYIGFKELNWGEEINQEIVSTLEVTNYPNISMVENLLTIEGVDCVLISNWLHFLKNVHPIYDKDACSALTLMGIDIPFRPSDLTCYSKYVSVIEGLKEYAPAGALPEYALPRQKLLQIGLACWYNKRE